MNSSALELFDSSISRTLFTQPSSELSGWMLPVSLYFQCAA